MPAVRIEKNWVSSWKRETKHKIYLQLAKRDGKSLCHVNNDIINLVTWAVNPIPCCSPAVHISPVEAAQPLPPHMYAAATVGG